jgi:hypothetical protein
MPCRIISLNLQLLARLQATHAEKVTMDSLREAFDDAQTGSPPILQG